MNAGPESIGTIRRDLLNHVIVFGEKHLYRLLKDCLVYYHESRTHLSLDRNAPVHRDVEPPEKGKVIAIPQVGGLHQREAWHKYRFDYLRPTTFGSG
jgi:hypothetical protein